MNMKNFLPKALLIGLAVLVFSANSALAASLTLTKIGALDVGTKKLSGQWWYTSTNPTLYGAAGESATVTINIDGTEGSANADSSGNWQFYSDKLTNGNHTVAISSGGESMSFSLNIGPDVPESTSSTSGNAVPVTGNSSLLVYIAISAILLIAGGLLINHRK